MSRLWRNIAVAGILWAVGFAIGFIPAGDSRARLSSRWEAFRMPSFSELLRNNATVALVLFSGIFCGGVTSVLTILYNGFVLGLIVQEGLRANLKAWVIAAVLGLHGVVEVTGLLLAAAVGLYGWNVLQTLLGVKPVPSWEDFRPFLLAAGLALLLIIAASWIEAHVTLPFAGKYLN
jgi:uncharacterized membrane protein SpoIIM required for sporulation